MAEPIHITDQQLIELAGTAEFERGRAYVQQGRVGPCSKMGPIITAEVAGSRGYTVRLVFSETGLSGSCTCPAGGDLCKHCVAVALAYRQQAGQSEQVAAPGGVDDKALKKRITAAFPINRHLFHYPQVRGFFAKAEPVVDELAQQFYALPPQAALRLVDYALQRLARALTTVDDSGGFREGIVFTLGELHRQAVARLDWAPEKVAAYLHNLAAGELEDVYPEIPSAYAGWVREQVMHSYYRLVQAEWDALPPLRPGAEWDEQYRYMNLQQPLLEQARAQGDFVAEVKLLAKTATDERNLLDLCTLCMDHQQWDQAELWLARARKSAAGDNNRHTSLGADRLQIRLHLNKGESAQALGLQWKIFKQSVAVKDYEYLLELNQAHAGATDYALEARRYLISRLDDEQNQRYTLPFTTALMAIYLHENDLALAAQLCQQREVDASQQLQLARRLKNQPIAAMPLYRKVVAKQVSRGNNQAYRRGVELLEELAQTLQVPAHQIAFTELVNELRAECKMKRNFVKMLDGAFG